MIAPERDRGMVTAFVLGLVMAFVVIAEIGRAHV